LLEVSVLTLSHITIKNVRFAHYFKRGVSREHFAVIETALRSFDFRFALFSKKPKIAAQFLGYSGVRW
jgi:hypothetical protein